MFQAAYLLARQLQRVPSVEEAVAFYEANGLNSGQDIEDRRRLRATDAVASCQTTFRAAEKRGVRRYLKLVESLVTDDDVKKAEYSRVLHREDIAIALYVVTGRLTRRQPNPYFQNTVGQEFMIGAFKKLKEVKLSPRSMDAKKWAAIKRVLLKAGLLVKVGDYGTGFAEQFALGPNHPMAKRGVRNANTES